MSNFLITYDLNHPGKNYNSLITKIKTYENIKICKSVWIIKSNSSSVEIRDLLSQEIDINDSLFVSGLTGEAAWRNCLESNEKIIKILE